MVVYALGYLLQGMILLCFYTLVACGYALVFFWRALVWFSVLVYDQVSWIVENVTGQEISRINATSINDPYRR